ncbi:Transposase type 1 [Trinorchestia longiramus]|nr:Transposase type 1 [Trinorchestia longiramus]
MYFKLGHNASEASANINRAWGEESTRDRTVRRWFGKFRSGDESLKDEEGRERLGSLENEQLHAVVEQNPRQSVREMSQTLGVSIATVSRHLKIIGNVKKLDKWVPHELNENQNLRRFEVCSMLSLRNTNDPFLDRIVTCDEKWVLYDNRKRSGQWLDRHEPPKHFPKPMLHQKKIMGVGTSLVSTFESKMFTGITNYFWGSPSSAVQESHVSVPSVQDPDEVFGDLKSMEVTSDLEEGLQTPQSPSDAEEDWVVLSGNGRIIEVPSRADRKSAKKLRNETQVPARDTEVHELDNRLDDLPERVETSLEFKPSRRRETPKRCARTEVSAQHLLTPYLKPANHVVTTAVQLKAPSSEPPAMAVSVAGTEKYSDTPCTMATEPDFKWKTVRRCRAVGSSDAPSPIETRKNRFFSDVLPSELESSFEDVKVSVKSLSPTKKARRARKSLKKFAHKQNRTPKHHVEDLNLKYLIEVRKSRSVLCPNNLSETERTAFEFELSEINKKYREINTVCSFNREVTNWFSKGNDPLYEYMNMLDKFGKKYYENEKLRLPGRHEMLIKVLNDRHNSSDLMPKSRSKLEPDQEETLEEKLKEKEREQELALALEELKPAQKALQKQQHEKLSRKYLLKTNLVREVSAAGRSRLRRSDRLNPSMSSGANNNRKCQ